MRTLKFRTWIWQQKRMLPPITIPEICKSYSMPLFWAEMMQFTGLLDKNGKEIYEGDLCKIVADSGAFRGGKQKHLAEVKWDGEDTGFFYATNHDCFPHVKPWFTISVEVIGNIYENPELLSK